MKLTAITTCIPFKSQKGKTERKNNLPRNRISKTDDNYGQYKQSLTKATSEIRMFPKLLENKLAKNVKSEFVYIY